MDSFHKTSWNVSIGNLFYNIHPCRKRRETHRLHPWQRVQQSWGCWGGTPLVGVVQVQVRCRSGCCHWRSNAGSRSARSRSLERFSWNVKLNFIFPWEEEPNFIYIKQFIKGWLQLPEHPFYLVSQKVVFWLAFNLIGCYESEVQVAVLDMMWFFQLVL